MSNPKRCHGDGALSVPTLTVRRSPKPSAVDKIRSALSPRSGLGAGGAYSPVVGGGAETFDMDDAPEEVEPEGTI